MEKISSHKDDTHIVIEQAKKEEGYTAYFIRNHVKKYIWSKYEPQKVAKDSICFEGSNKEMVWIVLGVGLGYTTKEILDKAGQHARVIIIEPTQEILDMQKPYIKQVLEDKRVKVFCGDDINELESILKQTISIIDLKNIKVMIQSIYREYFGEYYGEMIECIQAYMNKTQVDYNTGVKFSKIYLENLIFNKEAIKEAKNIEVYHNKYENIPAVIVSAGPSLSKNIEHLKAFKGVIFTGGRSLPHVIRQGVSPHFLVSIDPTEISYETLQEGKDNVCNLICTEVTNHLIVEHNKGNKYFLNGTSEKIAKELLGIELHSLPMYGSVATLCLSAAYYMGCNPIVFIGQDLAYTDAKAHVDEYKSYQVDKSTPTTRYIEGIDGQMVATDISLLLFLKWFENFIKDTKHKREYINCTEGGANIKGTQIRRFKEVVDAYSDEYKIEFDHQPMYDQTMQESIDSKMNETVESLRDTMKIAQRGIVLSEKLRKEYVVYKAKRQSDIHKILKELDEKVDHRLKQANKLITQIFSEEYTKIASSLEYKEPFDESENQTHLRIVERSSKLYENIYDAIGRTLAIIEPLIREKKEKK